MLNRSQAHRVVSVLRFLRVMEAAPFCGVALLGGLWREQALSPQWLMRMGLVMMGAFCLASFAFAFNDLQDVENDRQSNRKSRRPLVDGSLSRRAAWLILGLLLLGAGVTLWLGLGWPLCLMGWATIPLSAAYNLRMLSFKSLPVLSSLMHCLCANLVFLSGAAIQETPNIWTTAVGLYFGLVFAAGHLHHEAADHEADLRCGVRTHAVRLGQRPALLVGFGLWCVAGTYFSVLAFCGIVSLWWGWIQVAMVASYVIGFFALMGRGSGVEARRLTRLKVVYRLAYLAGGSLMAATSLLEIHHAY